MASTENPWAGSLRGSVASGGRELCDSRGHVARDAAIAAVEMPADLIGLDRAAKEVTALPGQAIRQVARVSKGGWCCCSGRPDEDATRTRYGLGDHSGHTDSRVGLGGRLGGEHTRVAQRVTEMLDGPGYAKIARGSADSRADATARKENLPVIIVPGLCSSGLKVLKSTHTPR